MHTPESIQENEMHKILWYLLLKTDHLISARPPDLVKVKKKPAEKWILTFQLTKG